jgi:hypothetical protein
MSTRNAYRPPESDLAVLDVAHRRDDMNYQRFAIRGLLAAMTREEHLMERRQRLLAAHVEAAKETIEDNWRTEHWGREPLRPPAWRTETPDP